MSIEYFLAFNLVIDFALLAAVARGIGAFDWRRVLAADGVCAAYALFAAAHAAPWTSLPAQLALLAGVSALIAGHGGRVQRRAAGTLLGTAALLCGGASRLLPGTGPRIAPAGVAIGTAVLSLLLAARHPLRDGWQVNLRLCVDGRSARFPALIDTGNHLREPLSGRPVLIAEARLLRNVLPEAGYRVLRFGALGGSGDMACFRPSALWIERDGRATRAPDVWVAVAPGRLPGSARALAPCEFASYIH